MSRFFQYILLALLLLLAIASGAQNCPKNTIFVDKKIYQVCYSEKFKNPVKVSYKIYKPKSDRSVSREGLDFYKEDGIVTATDKDYMYNVYDKGHLAPAETFSNSNENIKLTFSYLNCAVQNQYLNRGVWKALEKYERDYAFRDSLFVINEVIFEKNKVTGEYSRLKTGAYIPDYFVKTIINLRTKTKRVFKFPNVTPKEGSRLDMIEYLGLIAYK